MGAKKKPAEVAQGVPSSRYQELKDTLLGRRRELQAEVQGKMRDAGDTSKLTKFTDVFDAGESSGNDIQEDIELALLQMKAMTLGKVDDALARLEQGDYGNCSECGDEIAEKRLRALPFAVRCKTCEEQRERQEQLERHQAQRKRPGSLLP